MRRSLLTKLPVSPPVCAGIAHEELLLRLKVHRSAAGIAEAICSKASDLGADAVIIGSLGAGVLADFGSVARCAAASSHCVLCWLCLLLRHAGCIIVLSLRHAVCLAC